MQDPLQDSYGKKSLSHLMNTPSSGLRSPLKPKLKINFN